MSEELVTEGYGDQVEFVVINDKFADTSVTNLTDACDFPVFQDTTDVGAWALHGGNKDDIFIFNDGLLMTYLPNGGEVSISLTGAGYANVKGAIMDAINAP
jgi:hypothetical protein